MGGACGTYGGRRGVYRVLVGETRGGGKSPLRRPRRKYKNNSKMGLQEICVGLEWFDLAHNTDNGRALLSTVIKLRLP